MNKLVFGQLDKGMAFKRKGEVRGKDAEQLLVLMTKAKQSYIVRGSTSTGMTTNLRYDSFK